MWGIWIKSQDCLLLLCSEKWQSSPPHRHVSMAPLSFTELTWLIDGTVKYIFLKNYSLAQEKMALKMLYT